MSTLLDNPHPARVQESGLLKDDIRIDFPVETGQFDTVLLARATRKAKRSTEQWRAYAETEGNLAQAVVPLLVVQVPNKPPDDLLLSAFTTIRDAWPELEPDSMAHVFGDHATVEIGSFTVPHVSPEAVQDRRHIRVLFAKDAISTGWDCPRAEVLVSFRPARDETHITQLLGRMVRTPLARRIPGNDLLNSVECLLPHFDRGTAAKVAEAMLGDREQDLDGTGGGAGRRVLVAPVDMEVNQTISEAVWEVFDSLPSQTLPRRAARPIGRMAALAQALARDGLRPRALEAAYQRLFAKLDGLAIQYEEQVRTVATDILQVSGETVVVSVVGGEVAEGGAFVESADERSVEADFRAARRILTPDLARRYADHIAVEGEGDDGIFDARVKVAALAQVEGVPNDLEHEADELARKWFGEYRVAIKGLSDERRDVYETIKSLSPEPQVTEIRRPRVRTEETEDADGNKLEARVRHLMSDVEGNFPVGRLNRWELEVLDKEMARQGFQAWYRNPGRASADALAIAYRDPRGHWRRMCPDLLFFHGKGEDVKVSIVDPHGHHFSDALPKLRGLAEFGAAHGSAFHRIESVARMSDGRIRVLDLLDPSVQEATKSQGDAETLYLGDLADDYL